MKTILKTLLLLIALSAAPVFAQSDYETTKVRAEAGDAEAQMLIIETKIFRARKCID
jgi:hypothetical protein